MSQKRDHRQHPHPELLERFMRNEAAAAERRWIVRHLIAGCSRCLAVTRKLWPLGDPPPDEGIGEAPRDQDVWQGQGHRAPAGAGVGEAAAQGADLAAELLAGPPAARAALLELLRAGDAARPGGGAAAGGAGLAAARSRFLTPAVCEALLARSREAAPTRPGLALHAVDLALAIAEGLHAATGSQKAAALRVRAWAHRCQARRLADDLEGAEWALAMAEALAGGATPAGPAGGATALGTAGWAELLAFKAGLFADRGDLAGADRLLGRAAGLFRAAAEPHRAGRALLQQGWIRAELGDLEGAADAVRAGLGQLDPGSEPRLAAADLYRLAALLRGLVIEEPATGAAHDAAAPPASGPAAPANGATAQAPRPAFPAPSPAPRGSAEIRAGEALQLLARARALYRQIGDGAAEAQLSRLQGQIEAAAGRHAEAEATLRAAVAALALHGLGREAAAAQVELARVLACQGRVPEVRRLRDDTRAIKQALDKSWRWYSALFLFQSLREPAAPRDAALLGELARFLTPHQPPQPPPDRRLARVA